MKYRDLKPHSKQAVDTMAELLDVPPGRLAGNLPVRRTFRYVTAPPGDSNPLGDSFPLRPVLIPETDAAAREAGFTVLLTNGNMGPLYSAGTILLYKRRHASRQEHGLFLPSQETFIRHPCYKRGITKLITPNLNFKGIAIHKNDSLKHIGIITGIAHGYRWEQPGPQPDSSCGSVLFTPIL